jgi:hypothetical protein
MGELHELRAIERMLQAGLDLLGQISRSQDQTNVLLLSIATTVQSIDAKILPPDQHIIGATSGTLYLTQGENPMADQFNPGTPVLGSAAFTKPDPNDASKTVPGQIDGLAVWASDNTNDKITVSADGFSATIDGSANTGGTADKPVVSNITVTGDGDLGKGVVPVVLSGTINWIDAVDIEATGGTLTLSAQPAMAAAARRHR